MKNALSLKVFAALAIMGAGLLLTGCKPDLTQANALALIQAKYDAMPVAGVNVTVDDLGMREGITAKYWTRTKEYPNKFWADFTLTDEGKKALKLQKGGDVIEWRPLSANDTTFSVVVVTVAANHLKARDISEVRDEVVPGVEGTAKVADYTEAVNMDGVPAPLQGIAHNPGNKLSSKHSANFALDNGAWKLFSIN